MRKSIGKFAIMTMTSFMMFGTLSAGIPEKVEAACITHNIVSDYIKTEVLRTDPVSGKDDNGIAYTCTETTYLNVYLRHCTNCDYTPGGYTTTYVSHSNSRCPNIKKG